ncbi:MULTISPECIES: class A sortase [unclassified Gemella]|uniref:class A sortase n=1 Tax=unclassified Gemella TaxID=2624949 RepID=UPI001C03ECCD|nr:MULTISPECIES: class A sortase [unclassified Gemella]MBU0278851.1 class A sortase [Gemella sp. zg-1178]QWQ39398.1 class A sortase [Gemella sp. zg-570]
MKNKRIKIIIINLIIAILLITSLLLIFKNKIREYLTGSINDKIITAYKNNEEEVSVPWWQKAFTDNSSNIQLTDSMLGILLIDDLKIQEPIFQGDSEINLLNGVATVDPKQSLDDQNVVLAGHSVLGIDIRFYNLRKIQVGTEVNIVTKDRLLKYQVSRVYNVFDNQVEILNQHPGEANILTMFTCDAYNYKTGVWEERFVVEAKFLGEEKA